MLTSLVGTAQVVAVTDNWTPGADAKALVRCRRHKREEVYSVTICYNDKQWVDEARSMMTEY